MEGVNTDLLKRVIESQHGGTGAFVQSVRVVKPATAKDQWDGLVHVFDLRGHAQAKRAYAWAAPIKGSTAPRYFAVLQQGKIKTPIDAVKAAAAAIERWG